MIALWHAHGSDSHWAHGMLTRFRDPLWMCREGLAASGTDGTAVWDTSLTVQAVLDSELQLQSDDLDAMSKALEFLDNTQIRENPLGIQQVYRHPSQGGWPFSTRDQGYAVSDTTAEALKAVLLLQNKLPQSARVSEHRLQQAVDLLLGMESAGGGFAAYEKVRGPAYLEHFNITDSYEDCMVESRYAECTGSVIMAFTEFTRLYPDYRSEDIHLCIERSVTWLLEAQFPEGGWLGSWGVCFSFASMFALEGLACAGLYEHNSMAVRRACQFLRSNQNSDGGWGEALESSKAKRYIQEPKGSQVPQTAYALVGLVTADCADHNAIRRGIDFLIRKQQPNGDWLPGTLEGIYTPPCGYRYPITGTRITIVLSDFFGYRHADTYKGRGFGYVPMLAYSYAKSSELATIPMINHSSKRIPIVQDQRHHVQLLSKRSHRKLWHLDMVQSRHADHYRLYASNAYLSLAFGQSQIARKCSTGSISASSVPEVYKFGLALTPGRKVERDAQEIRDIQGDWTIEHCLPIDMFEVRPRFCVIESKKSRPIVGNGTWI
ncbi:oxidosqualene-lanosterol cyclase, partial [Hortaea werneckii]